MDNVAQPQTAEVAYTPTEIEAARRQRIRIAIEAYAIECWDSPRMSPGDYARLAEEVGASRAERTGHTLLDRFFREDYTVLDTSWVRDHPEIDRVERMYRRRTV